MGIKTKFNPLGALPKSNGGGGGSGYNAYIILGDTIKNVNTMGFPVEINPNLCFGATKEDDCCYIILNGKLYRIGDSSLTLVNGDNDWTAVCGDNSTGLGIKNGYLYFLKGASITQLDSDNNWTLISGKTDNYSGAPNAYGVKNGLGYKINNTSIEYVSNASVTDIAGFTYTGGNYYAYIRRDGSGLMYYHNGSSLQATDVSVRYGGFASSFSYNDSDTTLYYAYILSLPYESATSYDLYAVNARTGTKISSGGWSMVSGFSSNDGTIYAYGINNGYLYRLGGSTITSEQVGVNNGWTNICGYYNSNSNNPHYAYGIKDNTLYKITNKTTTQLLNDCIKIFSCSSYSNNKGVLAICGTQN